MTREEWERNQNKYGSAGLIHNGYVDPRTLTNGSSGQGWNFDPRYMREVQDYSSEGGGQKTYEFTDHYNKLFDNGNTVQVRDYSRLKDPNAMKWGGDEVGYTTSKDNYTDDTDGVDKAFETASFAAIGAAPFLHMAGLGQFGSTAQNWLNPGGANGSGGLGLTGGDLPYGTEMPNTYSPGANPTSFYEPLGPGPEGLSGGDMPHGTEMPNTYSPGTNPSPLGAPPGGAAGAFSGLGSGLEGLLGAALKNPMQALGLLNAGMSLFGGQNGSGSNGGASGEAGGLFAPLPKGNRGPWTPNPVTAGQINNFKWSGQ